MTIRWGIIGCGDIARKRVANAIQIDERSQLLAVCRRDAAKLRQFCDDFDVPRGYASAEELIADSQVNAVYIATPVKDHRPQTLAAAAAGKHVLCEKPMALDVSECDAMIAACREHDVHLGVAYYRRFYPVVRRMKELIAHGEIGEVLAVNILCATPFAIEPNEDGYWRVLPDAGGGGALMDIGSHRINLLLDMFGPIADVKAMCGTVSVEYEAENVASVLFRFQSGPQGMLTCLFNTPHDLDEFVVTGTRGRLRSAPLNGGQLEIQTADQHCVEQHPPHANLHAPLIADFTAAILANHPPTVTGEEGQRATLIMDRAYTNARG